VPTSIYRHVISLQHRISPVLHAGTGVITTVVLKPVSKVAGGDRAGGSGEAAFSDHVRSEFTAPVDVGVHVLLRPGLAQILCGIVDGGNPSVADIIPFILGGIDREVEYLLVVFIEPVVHSDVQDGLTAFHQDHPVNLDAVA